MNTPALKVDELSICMGSGAAQRRLVDRVSFSIQPSRGTGLVGESGCGKTLTALAILGLLPAGMSFECKSIMLNGREVSTLDNRQRRTLQGNDIAMVFQQPGTALDPVFTLGHQIASVYRRHKQVSRAQARRVTLESLASVGFSRPREIAAAYPHQLSGGMRQLTMIAMAMVCKPSVIIADEPTTALDASIRSLVLRQLDSLRERYNTALLLISHDLSVVRRVCDDALVMYCGRVLEQAPCGDLFTHPRHPYTAGLLACIPSIDGDEAPPIQTIPGQVPSVFDLPPGCHFAPRCPRVEEQCVQSAPEHSIDSTREVACFRPLS